MRYCPKMLRIPPGTVVSAKMKLSRIKPELYRMPWVELNLMSPLPTMNSFSRAIESEPAPRSASPSLGTTKSPLGSHTTHLLIMNVLSNNHSLNNGVWGLGFGVWGLGFG